MRVGSKRGWLMVLLVVIALSSVVGTAYARSDGWGCQMVPLPPDTGYSCVICHTMVTMQGVTCDLYKFYCSDGYYTQGGSCW